MDLCGLLVKTTWLCFSAADWDARDSTFLRSLHLGVRLLPEVFWDHRCGSNKPLDLWLGEAQGSLSAFCLHQADLEFAERVNGTSTIEGHLDVGFVLLRVISSHAAISIVYIANSLCHCPMRLLRQCLHVRKTSTPPSKS